MATSDHKENSMQAPSHVGTAKVKKSQLSKTDIVPSSGIPTQSSRDEMVKSSKLSHEQNSVPVTGKPVIPKTTQVLMVPRELVLTHSHAKGLVPAPLAPKRPSTGFYPTNYWTPSVPQVFR